MSNETYGLMTFKSTNFALQGEQVLKSENLAFKTIPTPRDVSTSCGLSLLFLIDEIDRVKDLINMGKIKIDGMYKYTKSSEGSKSEKIL